MKNKNKEYKISLWGLVSEKLSEQKIKSKEMKSQEVYKKGSSFFLKQGLIYGGIALVMLVLGAVAFEFGLKGYVENKVIVLSIFGMIFGALLLIYGVGFAIISISAFVRQQRFGYTLLTIFLYILMLTIVLCVLMCIVLIATSMFVTI